jgi:hypothetical protein
MAEGSSSMLSFAMAASTYHPSERPFPHNPRLGRHRSEHVRLPSPDRPQGLKVTHRGLRSSGSGHAVSLSCAVSAAP